MYQRGLFPEFAGLEVRVQLVRDGNLKKGPQVCSPDDCYAIIKVIGKLDREHFLTICLNARNEILSVETTAIGTPTANLCHPREVFKTAILSNAVGIIVAHNHPSGDPEPSADDLEVTRRLVQAGKLLNIEVLDHLIVGGDRFISLKEKGVM